MGEKRLLLIINPISGAYDKRGLDTFVSQRMAKVGYSVETVYTKGCGDASLYAQRAIADGFDAVAVAGGDGTINEVVSGAINYPNVSVCVYPCGSGNDFVKSIGTLEFYNDIEKILNAKTKKIDVIKVGNDNYSINVCNYGFEAKVAKYANQIKKKGGKNPYLRGVIRGLFTGMKNKITVEADGEVLNPSGTLLLSSSANGGYVGGKYFCAPNFVLDDGLLEVTLVKQVSVFTLIKLIKQRPSPLEKVEVAQDMRNINYIVEVINDIVNNWDLYTSIDELKRKD
jgi:diacylglycerol kinase (ATP)